MDMKISGSGQIAAGEYKKVRISGSGKINGPIRCDKFLASGSARSEGIIECREEFNVSGSGKFDGAIKAGCLSVSGAFTCEDNINVSGEVKCSGSMECGGSLKGGYIEISGTATVAGEVEAETIEVQGRLNCDGLLNAEEINIAFVSGMDIGSIGGGRISIYRGHNGGKRISRLPLFSSLIPLAAKSKVNVKTAIEGDVIAIENVSVPRVSGRIVAIGEDCEVDLVQYSEQIEVSPNAKVGKVEKV
ncbi:MAG: polymer-forming cytoskeletal protein [Oscillospiraceae bacterium]|nr:polymer-forming cytoskeletal protein [Oscillospiraceae bacterium]